MLDLFRTEAEGQAQVLTAGLLALERQPHNADELESCMRAAHSLKGAARIVGIDAGVAVAHAMEDCFVAAQKQQLLLGSAHIDLLLRALDLLVRISNTVETEMDQWAQADEVDRLLIALANAMSDPGVAVASANRPETPAADTRLTTAESVIAADPALAAVDVITAPGAPPGSHEGANRSLRVSAENLNRLLGLASESLVKSRWLKPFSQSLLRVKRMQHQSVLTLGRLHELMPAAVLSEATESVIHEAQQQVLASQQLLQQRLDELEAFDSASINLANRLYQQALASRMRPFSDLTLAYPRMVRDVAHALGKSLRLEIIGLSTQVDRDILEQLDAPIGHLLRNAIDHGIESPEQRLSAAKPAEGVVVLEARHSAGMLQISVTDDGGGIDLQVLRDHIVERGLTSSELVQRMSDAEVLEFLFLPGFSLKPAVTDISGRGVGLDVVQDLLKRVRGNVRVSTSATAGTRFTMQLPLTLSVIRALLVEIGAEPYAFPLAYIVRTLKLARSRIQSLEGRQHFNFEGTQVGLVQANQILGGPELGRADEDLPVIIIGNQEETYGLVIDRFLGERDLVVQPLDARLGRIKDISAGALMEDGSPALIVDVADLIRSVDKLICGGELLNITSGSSDSSPDKRKRILVVDDSLTVREVERKLLVQGGYEVEVAVDGVDGWNVVRSGPFDLVITDIDMPRMDGIALITAIRKDPGIKSMPVMIVSYKDRDEERRRGLDAGADCYLTKGSFHDESLLQAVIDLIGEPL